MITIVGAGPVGSYLASLFKDQDVMIFEDHTTIGRPVQCTGITTSAINQFVKPTKRFVVNEIDRARIISPDKNFIDLKLKDKNLIIDRCEFDRHLVEKAIDSGAELFLGHKYIRHRQHKGKVAVKFKGRIDAFNSNLLIGADGPFSKVAHNEGLLKNRDYVYGAQARVKMDVDPGLVEFFVKAGCFGWVVPESDTHARVGIAARKDPHLHFKSLLKNRCITAKIKEHQSGVIPVYDPKVKTQNKHVFLVGDAATHVKATTFGGLVHGFMGAEALFDSLKNKNRYDKVWRQKMGTDLRISLMMRKKIDKLSDKQFNKLVGIFNKDKVKNVLETHDRDFPSKFLFKLLLKEPRLLGFAF